MSIRTLATDDFNRADANPAGSPWSGTVPPWDVTYKILSNALQQQSDSGDHIAVHDDGVISWPNDQCSQGVIRTTVNADGGPCVRGLAGTKQGYFFGANIATGNYQIQKFVAGANSTIASAAGSWADGDTITIEAVGTSIRGYKNGVLVISVTDTSLASGRPGFYGWNGPIWESWAGGDKSLADITQLNVDFGSDNNSESTYTLGTENADISTATASTRIIRTLLNFASSYIGVLPTLYYDNDDAGSYVPVPVGSSVAEAYGTVSFVAIGTGSNGSTSVTPSYPAGIAANQYLVCMVSSGGTGNPTPSTPGGWTSLGSATTTDGTYGVDTGPRRMTAFGKIADGTESGTLSVTITSGDTCRATISSFSKAGSGSWVVDGVTANDSGAHTSISMAGAALTWNTGDATIVGVSQRVDTATQSSQSLTASGVTFGARTNRASTAVTTGNDHRHVVDTFAAITGTSAISAAPTWAYTASAAASAAGMIIRLREYTAPVTNLVYITPSSNVTAGGEATTARLTPPSGKTTADFVTGRIWDNENGSDSLDVATGKYTEVAWVVKIDRTSGFTRFRVRDGSGALGTYTNTPKWTISTGTTISGALEAISVTTFAAVVSSNRALAAALESIGVSTFSATVSSNRIIAGALETLAVTTYPAALSRTVSTALELIGVSTFAALISTDRAIAGALETIAVSTFAATFARAISADIEALQVTTFAAMVGSDRAIAAALESLTVTTYPAAFSRDISAATEAIALMTFAAVVSTDRLVATALESLAVTTYPATFARAISAALESIAVTTNTAAIVLQNIIAGTTAQIVVEPFPATVNSQSDTSISAELEAIEVTAHAAIVANAANIAAELETIQLSTFGALVSSSRAIAATLETLQVTTFPAALAHTISAALEAIAVTTHAAVVGLQNAIAANVEAIAVETFGATVQATTDTHISGSVEQVGVSTFAAVVRSDRAISTALETLSVTTYPAAFTRAVSAGTEQISVQTARAAISLDRTLAAALESIVVTPRTANIAIGAELHGTLETVLLTTYPATLIIDKSIHAQLESIALRTYHATIVSPVRPILDPGLQYTITAQGLEFTFEAMQIDFSFPLSRIDFTFED